jgi:hypothetical protein
VKLEEGEAVGGVGAPLGDVFAEAEPEAVGKKEGRGASEARGGAVDGGEGETAAVESDVEEATAIALIAVLVEGETLPKGASEFPGGAEAPNDIDFRAVDVAVVEPVRVGAKGLALGEKGGVGVAVG